MIARACIGSLPEIPEADLPAWAAWLWTFGNSTADIAEIIGVPEADVCRMLVRPGEEREPWHLPEVSDAAA